MGSTEDATLTILKLVAVLILVLANGFFVAAEFALVSVRRSRVKELVADRRTNAKALEAATDRLDSHLAATQLGITISSLALGWLGEPAIAHLVEPLLAGLPWGMSEALSHGIAVAVAFFIITSMHIVLGELAPKSLAIQRSERTALATVRLLSLFLLLFRPAILFLNGLGNGVLRLCGLRAGHGEGEGAHHTPAEIRVLMHASQEAGLLEPGQVQAVGRVLSAADRRVDDIMTPRVDICWLDLDDEHEEIVRAVMECPHEQIVACRGGPDEFVGVAVKRDLLRQVLSGGRLDVAKAVREAPMVHEHLPVFKALELFRQNAARLAFVIDEYGGLQGIVTQTDLLEALAGEMPDAPGETPMVEAREDGSLLIDASMHVNEAFERLDCPPPPDEGFNTVAGFAISRIGRIPQAGERFAFAGWDFEVVRLEGRRIVQVLASRPRQAEMELAPAA